MHTNTYIHTYIPANNACIQSYILLYVYVHIYMLSFT